MLHTFKSCISVLIYLLRVSRLVQCTNNSQTFNKMLSVTSGADILVDSQGKSNSSPKPIF